jgi:hypothetical protein
MYDELIQIGTEALKEAALNEEMKYYTLSDESTDRIVALRKQNQILVRAIFKCGHKFIHIQRKISLYHVLPCSEFCSLYRRVASYPAK